MDRGEFTAASIEVDAALAHFGTLSPEWEWRFRILKARIIVSSAKGEEALSVLSLEPPASLATTDIPEQRKLYQGIAHRSAQQFSDAEHDFESAGKLAEPLGAFYVCQFLIADAALWVDERKYDQAEASYRKALALARHNSFPRFEATVLADWARLATAQRHYDEALERNLEALRLARSLDLRGNIATILGNLGWGYSELGDFESSLDFFDQSAQASAARGLKDYSAYWFSGVASSYLALREYRPAEALARSTLERAKELNDSETTALCLNTLAEIMLRTNRLVEAKRFNQDALNIEESGRDKLVTLDSLTLAGKIATAVGRFSDGEGFFQRVLADPNVEPQLRWQAQAGLAQVRDGQAEPADAERKYLEAIETIESARRSINHDELRLSFLSTGIEVYGNYIDFLIRRGRPPDALNQAEISRARTLAEGLSLKAPSATLRPAASAQSQKLAQRTKATILFYWLGEKHSYLWVITPVKTTCITLASAQELDPIVKSYQETLLAGRDPLETQNANGQKLYEMLIEPAKNLIPQGSRVILLPDGSLYGLNFETLIVPGPRLHYWIEDATVTTASSLTLLASAAEAGPVPKPKSIFLVGDTIPPNAEFPKLQHAAAEMQSIEKYFPGPRRAVLSGSGATPAAYLSSKPEQYGYLHFVTHGTASRARPLESAVVLSKERDDDSYKLYARDIVKRHLSAYLVTISACNGAGTRAFSGEGLVGLSWAFLRAGAHNVIGALWEVSDSAAPQLMDKLYGGLSRGQDPASALRAAKLSLLHSERVFRRPYYWAPFQLYAGS